VPSSKYVYISFLSSYASSSYTTRITNQTIFGVGLGKPGPAFIQQEKKRVHRKALGVDTYHVSRVRPSTKELLEASRAKLLEMAEKDKERMLLEEAKNKVESYFYMVKNKLSDDEDAIAAVSTEEQREECRKLAEDTEDWLYYEGGPSADLATMVEKYVELSSPFEKILLRINENKERPKVVEKIEKQLGDIEKLMTQWNTTMPQVTEEEKAEVLDLVEAIRKNIADKVEEQAAKKAHEEPAFLSIELATELKPLETMVLKLSKKPKPKPPPKKKKDANATSADNATDTNTTDANTTEGDSGAEADDAAAESTEEAGAGNKSRKEKMKEDVTAADTGDEL
jgi:hypoxia up-regulated 1